MKKVYFCWTSSGSEIDKTRNAGQQNRVTVSVSSELVWPSGTALGW